MFVPAVPAVPAVTNGIIRYIPYPKRPSQTIRIIKHTIEVDNVLHSNRRTLCCRLECRNVIYFIIMCIIISASIFCIYQLLTLNGCNDQQMYLGLLLFVLGIIIPSPKFTK
jgi:hypothetical protein